MTTVVVHPELRHLRSPRAGRIPVHLYGASAQRGMGAIGGPILDVVSRIDTAVDATAFDFLSLSLAVTAADTFVNRGEAADGWVRDIHLIVALADPGRWVPVIPILERALRFLSGDQWRIEVRDGGTEPPSPRPRVTNKLVIAGSESACLYSGGLDSTIGMLNLRAEGHRTVLISHAYSHDASRQEQILGLIRSRTPRLALHAHPRQWLGHANDVQMRTRSFNFFAMGTLIAATLAQGRPRARRVPLFIPENGLIAINPPLTNRRIGALSTRTTHPHYLGLMQEILNKVGLRVQLQNPYALKTKGEMIRECRDQDALEAVAASTVSCGKWKRSGQQCGKCVPCLIRRASFHGAGWDDETPYKSSGIDLQRVIENSAESDDLMAMILASRRLRTIDVSKWISNTGPISNDVDEFTAVVDVVERGMREVKRYLTSERLL